MERALRKLTQAFRAFSTQRSSAVGGRLVERLSAALDAGAAFGPALKETLPALVEASVDVASAKFDSGAVALFIVDLRDAVARRLEKAAALAGRKDGWGPWMKVRLLDVAGSLRTETVEQHLINAVLSVTGLYAEAMTLDVARVDRAELTRAVTTVLQRSLSTVFSRRELALTLERLGTLPVRNPFGPGGVEGAPAS